MSCMHCVKAVERELEKAGVENFAVKINSVSVKLEDNAQAKEKIFRAIEEAGFEVVSCK